MPRNPSSRKAKSKRFSPVRRPARSLAPTPEASVSDPPVDLEAPVDETEESAPKKKKLGQFQFDGRHALLTYSQCGGLDPWSVADHLHMLRAECIIGREDHADGGTHLHAFVDFGRRFRSRRTDVFDISGIHPNISPSLRTPEGGWDYAVKDGDVVAGGLARPSGVGTFEDRSVWHEIADAPDDGAFRECALRMDPKTFITSYSNVDKFAKWRYAKTPRRYEDPPGVKFELGMVPELDRWRELCLRTDRPRGKRVPSLCLFGRALTGKTTWARSLGPHLYFRQRFNGKDCVEKEHEVQYAVFDDMIGPGMGITFFNDWKGFWGCQSYFNIRLFHHDPPTIEWGKPIIWCCQRDPRSAMREQCKPQDLQQIEDDIKWMEDNAWFVEIEDDIVSFPEPTVEWSDSEDELFVRE